MTNLNQTPITSDIEPKNKSDVDRRDRQKYELMKLTAPNLIASRIEPFEFRNEEERIRYLAISRYDDWARGW